MKMKPLGRTGIMVSQLCLGSMTWGSQNSEAEAHEQLDHAVGEGINFIDTAEMYPTTPRRPETTGLTEEIIGSWLKGRADRDDLVIATKVTGEGNRDIRDGARVTAPLLRDALEGSLLRLKTDHVDLYQLHWPNRGSYHFRKHWQYDPSLQDGSTMDVEVEDMLGEVQKLIGEGKMRAFGLSNETAWGTMRWLAASERLGLPRIASMQNEYSLLCRAYDTDMAEVSVREDVGLMAFSPLAAGALSGKYAAGVIPAGSRRSIQAELNGRYTPAAEIAIRRYCEVAAEAGMTPAQLSIAFCLSRPFMTSAIIGATSMAQLREDIEAAGKPLNEETLAAIAAVRREFPMPM